MYPCHTCCLPPKTAKTMGHYKGKADAFVLLLGIVDPLLTHHGLAVCTWKDRRTPNFKMGVWVEKRGRSFRDIQAGGGGGSYPCVQLFQSLLLYIQ